MEFEQVVHTYSKLIYQTAYMYVGNRQAAEDITQDVLKTTVFVADLADFVKVNAVYQNFFEGAYPARSCVQVAALPKGGLVEIECIASK